jgi:hypothetical protein
MPGTPFYNDNTARSYPFVDDGALEMIYSGGGNVTLPDSAIADFTAIVGLDTGHDDVDNRIYLYEIRRIVNCFTFTFRFTATALSDYTLDFTRYIDDPEYAVESAEGTGPSESIELACGGVPIEAWLTTGLMDELAAVLPAGRFLRRADASIWVEPGRVQNLNQGFMRSANLANEPRTMATSPDICSSASVDLDEEFVVNAQCLAGVIKWKEGYNNVIDQNDSENSLQIGGELGRGAGQPCDEIALYEGETAPEGSDLLTGGPSCNDIIKTINGVGGRHMRFLSGLGVNITASDTDPHELIVDVNLHGLAICAPGSSSPGDP